MNNNPFDEILEELRELRAIILNKPEPQPGAKRKDYIRGINALAEFLGCSTSTVQKLKNRGKIPYSQYGRLILFDPEKVLDALNESSQEKKRG